MCTLEEFKLQNEKEHTHLKGMLNSLDLKISSATTVSKIVKWVASGLGGVILVLLGIIATFSGLTYNATSHARNVEINSYKVVNALQDTISNHWKIYTKEIQDQKTWTYDVYLKFILPADSLSKSNNKLLKEDEIRLTKIERGL